MGQLLQDGDFSQTCDRKSVSISALYFDLFESVKPAILLVSCLVNYAVCSHSDPLQLCEINDTSCVSDELLSFHK
jgi:hypothetical protein